MRHLSTWLASTSFSSLSVIQGNSSRVCLLNLCPESTALQRWLSLQNGGVLQLFSGRIIFPCHLCARIICLESSERKYFLATPRPLPSLDQRIPSRKELYNFAACPRVVAFQRDRSLPRRSRVYPKTRLIRDETAVSSPAKTLISNENGPNDNPT